MVLWPDWENLFIPLQSYSYMYIKTLLLFRDWNPDFCKFQGKRRSAGKIAEFEKMRVQFWTEGRTTFSPSYREFRNIEGSRKRDSSF